MDFQRINYSLKETVTTKSVPPNLRSPLPSVVRILVTDGDATDSSDSECGNGRRKYVHEIRLEKQRHDLMKKKRNNGADGKKTRRLLPENQGKKFRGVRFRP